ncbi:hypothetical protein CYMTET_20915 [Cymbomonas tetramitiformis]|uniref:Uncharacterized protein n=1 Tax=Cymbomonas tetramitiformis TaxID=36881 RepID=A0AAE0G3C6_9CHLO|nr:hypothetical protein CYMTET_20915 [Cymbomonas tetramitiformis]
MYQGGSYQPLASDEETGKRLMASSRPSQEDAARFNFNRSPVEGTIGGYDYADYTTFSNMGSKKATPSSNLDARESLLAGFQELELQSYQLGRGQNTLLESEATGANVLEELQRQRETIRSSRSNIQEINEDVNDSISILRWMGCRAATQRMLLCFASRPMLTPLVAFSKLETKVTEVQCVACRALRHDYQLQLSALSKDLNHNSYGASPICVCPVILLCV